MALIAQLGEHCTGIAEVVGSNPAQSLKIFSGLCSSSVTAALALMTVITQLLLWYTLLSFCLYSLRLSRQFAGTITSMYMSETPFLFCFFFVLQQVLKLQLPRSRDSESVDRYHQRQFRICYD